MIDDVAANAAAAKARGRTRIKGTDPRVRAVTDRIGRGTRPEGRERMTADMADERAGRRPSDADINDDFARRLMGGADAQAGKTRPTPAAVRGRGQVSLAWDDDPKQYMWHYSPAENATGIREGGLDPQFKGRHGDMAKGIHFAPDPDMYRPVGDKDWNVYRVRRDYFDEARPEFMESGDARRGAVRGTSGMYEPNDARNSLYQRATDDYYTPRRIDPSNIEVYEGPGRFGKLGGFTGMAGLVNNLSSMFGGPYLQTPADWVLNDLMAQAYNGGVMDPYRDYTGPRDPNTGAILA